MAKGKSSLARNYDKILAALSILLLAGAAFLWISAKGATAAGKRDCDADLAARHPAHPELDREEHFQRMMSHLHEKYGREGYLKLWFSDSPNAIRLEELRKMMNDEPLLRRIFDELTRN